VNTALALKNCEAPNTAAAGGHAKKAEAGAKTAETAEGFKKKLEDCEAVVVPMPSDTTSGSITNTDEGIQNNFGMIIPGADCMIEGREIPDHPSDIIDDCDEAMNMAAAMTLMDSMPEGAQADRTSENAWMQYTTAGDIPVQTQDQILETIGAYLDTASETGLQEPVVLVRQTSETQPLVSPEQTTETGYSESTTEAANVPNGAVSSELAETQNPIVPKAAEEPSITATEPLRITTTGEPGIAATKELGIAAEMDARRETKLSNDAGQSQSANALTAHSRETISVAGDATAEITTDETAQYTKENVLRIVDKVSTHSADGKYDFDVELKPDFLGKVRIKLTMEDGHIRMQIKTDDMSVKGMLSEQTSALQSALKEKGITLTNVDVTYESETTRDFGQQPHEQNGSSRQGLYYAQTETIGFEPAEELYGYYTGSSSVEFLA